VGDPDLVIRTGGERRISNFLLYGLAYAELHFADVLWPDFGASDLYAAIASYQQRERRFGLIGAQVAAGAGAPNGASASQDAAAGAPAHAAAGASARVAPPFPVDAALAGGASKITRIAI
jgi:hypothetical protein